MKTIKQFIKASHINAQLIRAVIRQIGGFDNFKQYARDVANHGADAGFSGFIYYTDTNAFFKRNKSAILECAKNLASDIGEDVFTMIAGFNCLKTDPVTVSEAIHNPRTNDPENVRNALAWFALEEVARSYSDLLDGQ